MRNISFQKTTEQIRSRTKTVTRRTWKRLPKPGELLQGIVKGQGLKKGQKVEKLFVIRVVSARREPLCWLISDAEYGRQEAAREGFPQMTGREFFSFFASAYKGVSPEFVVRIEFEYVEPK